jgi:outer membrane protein assembly factor BamB
MRFGRVLLGLTVLATAAGGCTSHDAPKAPKARVDQSTAAPVAALADTGPVPGSVTESWHVDLPRPVDRLGATETPEPPRLVNGQLVLASSRGLDVYDASTGKERWHYREPGRALRGYAATAGVLVAMTVQPDDSENPSLSRRIGLDAGTGRVLWTGRNDGVGFTEGTPSEVVASGGVVPMRKGEHSGDVFGVDARSGRTRWKRGHVGERGCETNDTVSRGTDGSLLLFRETCHGRDRILALDPVTGRERWRKDVVSPPGEGAPDTSVSGGMALIKYTTAFSIVAADGRELATGGDIGCYAQCRLQTTAGHALVVPMGNELGISSKPQTLIVDTRTGRKTTSPIGAAYLALTVAGGRVYGLHQHIATTDITKLLPAGLDVIDPATGTVRPRPLPFATSVVDDEPGEPAADWMAVAGGRLYLRRLLDKTERVTSYATTRPGGPAGLGGVRAADWPDACHVVPGFKAGDYPPAADRAATIGSTTLRNVECGVGDGATRVRTEWVAASPEQAHALLTMPATAQKTHVDGADEAYSLDDANDLWIRVGRFLMRVDDLDAKTRIRVASAMAKALRRR